jgi:hypothetical protein
MAAALNNGYTTRRGTGVGGSMPNVDSFLEEVVTDLRRRLLLLGDGGDRRAIEDAIALLTDYRLGGMDAARFETLLSSLRAGRSPVGVTVLKPEVIAAELARRWQEYGAGVAVAGRNQGIVELALRKVG